MVLPCGFNENRQELRLSLDVSIDVDVCRLYSGVVHLQLLVLFGLVGLGTVANFDHQLVELNKYSL